MANDFRAIITGEANLSKARQDFASFKNECQKPIKITFDTNGLNLNFGNLQRQAQQQGAQIGATLVQQIEKDVKNVKVNLPLERLFETGGATSIASHLGIDVKTAQAIKKELAGVNAEGAKLSKLTIGDHGKSFEAVVTSGNSAITVLGRLNEETDKLGITTSNWVTTTQKYTTNFEAGMRQAQQAAQKLSTELDKVNTSFITGQFDAQIAKMEQGLMSIGASVDSNLVQKASQAAAEYYKITEQIRASLEGTTSTPLQGQDLAKAYKDAEVALKTYNNAMIEVRANTQKMLAEGVGERYANNVESWAKKNSKALAQYGAQLDEIAQKMRTASTQGELNNLTNQFKNLQAEINAAGLGGMSFGDQLRRAFVHIGEFTGIYAITSQMRRLPREMAQEVIKIDTAMTELRKVSTASASEISAYFDEATDSAYKYGQAIDSVIDSTASWVKLGYNLEDASILTDVSSELAKVGAGLNVETSTEGLQSIIRGFGFAADEAKRVGDALNQVADTQPISATGIIEGLERSSATLRETNNTLEESMGLITATTSVTQDANSAGTAWRTVALRITGAKHELSEAGLETDGMVDSTAKLRDYMLQVAGIDILDETGRNFKSTYQIMEELSKVWGQLDDIDKSGILDKIAG